MSYTPNLKDREYYENRYDGRIITQCRMIEECYEPAVEHALKENKEWKSEDEIRFEVTKAMNIHLYFLKGDLATKRETKIEEWMKEDRDKDNFYYNAKVRVPYCIHCNTEMEEIMKQEFFTYLNKGKDRVLFMFQCKQCKYKRWRWDNGEEYKFNKPVCKKCWSEELKTEYIKWDERDIFRETCQNCHNVKDEVFENCILKEEIDPNYEKDRQRFVLSEKETMDFRQWTHDLESLSEILKKDEKKKEEEELIAKRQILDTPDMKEIIVKTLKKKKYKDITFSNPIVSKRWVTIELTVAGKSLEKKTFLEMIQESLENTNWKVNEKSILVNLGILQCKLQWL